MYLSLALIMYVLINLSFIYKQNKIIPLNYSSQIS